MTKLHTRQLQPSRHDAGGKPVGRVLTVRESSVVRERLTERSCAWCGVPVQYKGRGRPPQYCGAAHRTRAWELRRAQDSLACSAGRPRQTIREVVERTETIVRTEVREAPAKVKVVPGVRLSGEAYTLPEDAVEWVQALMYLRRHAGTAKVYPFREHVARACEDTASALRNAAPAFAVPDRTTEPASSVGSPRPAGPRSIATTPASAGTGTGGHPGWNAPQLSAAPLAHTTWKPTRLTRS